MADLAVNLLALDGSGSPPDRGASGPNSGRPAIGAFDPSSARHSHDTHDTHDTHDAAPTAEPRAAGRHRAATAPADAPR